MPIQLPNYVRKSSPCNRGQKRQCVSWAKKSAHAQPRCSTYIPCPTPTPQGQQCQQGQVRYCLQKNSKTNRCKKYSHCPSPAQPFVSAQVRQPPMSGFDPAHSGSFSWGPQSSPPPIPQQEFPGYHDVVLRRNSLRPALITVPPLSMDLPIPHDEPDSKTPVRVERRRYNDQFPTPEEVMSHSREIEEETALRHQNEMEFKRGLVTHTNAMLERRRAIDALSHLHHDHVSEEQQAERNANEVDFQRGVAQFRPETAAEAVMRQYPAHSPGSMAMQRFSPPHYEFDQQLADEIEEHQRLYPSRLITPGSPATSKTMTVLGRLSPLADSYVSQGISPRRSPLRSDLPSPFGALRSELHSQVSSMPSLRFGKNSNWTHPISITRKFSSSPCS